MSKPNSLIFKQANALATAAYRLTLAEKRLIALCAALSRGDADDLKNCSIHAGEYAHTYGVTVSAGYKALYEASQQLFEREWSYTTQDPKKRGKTNHRWRWVQSVNYDTDESDGYIRLVFSDAVIPLLADLKEQFSWYGLDTIAGLTSVHALRLYELMMTWRSTGKTPVYPIAEFRAMLGLNPDEYPRMTDFKRRVLDAAIKQINEHTDIHAEYEQHKTGRSITGLSFRFKVKQADRDPNTVDMLTGETDAEASKPKLKPLTDDQRLLFSAKLANDSRFSSGSIELDGYGAKTGESMDDFKTRIYKELGQSEKLKIYMPHLLRLGFKINMGKKKG